jgi:hypothetical protein
MRGAAGGRRLRRAGHLHHRQPRQRPGLGRQGGRRGTGDDRGPAVPGRRPGPGRRPEDPGRARAPARPVQLLLRHSEPAGYPDGSPHRPRGGPADRVPRPRLGRRRARDGGSDRFPVLHRLPARLPQAGPAPVVADRDPARDSDPGPDTRVRGAAVPISGHRRVGAPGRNPRLRRDRGPGGDRRAGGHPGPPRLGLDQRAGPGQARLRAEPGRPPTRRRPGRRRLPRIHFRAHPPSRAGRLGQRLLRQLRIVHLGGGGDRREVRPASGLRPQPADLLGRGDRRAGGARLGPGRAARRDQDGAVRRPRPQPALKHPPAGRVLARRTRLAAPGREGRPQKARPAPQPPGVTRSRALLARPRTASHGLMRFHCVRGARRARRRGLPRR